MLKIVSLQALLCLLLILQLAAAQDFRELIRGDNFISSSTFSLSSPESSSQHSFTSESNGERKQTDSTREPNTTKASDTTTSVTAKIQTTTTKTTSDSPLNNSNSFKASIPAGDLPIQPIITPGWGVAGIILMLTGLVYTLVGIKNRWINCFFSTAFITALGISVLIVYTTNVPVSLGIQSAYVIAVTLSGCALGAASLIFKESAEGLGCALGGFSLSMWFLCLASGGLLHNTIGRAIFISCFSAFGAGFYFSRYTRDWAMIILMSFGGATVIVLGIDCYSRAGLKEFWAYLWNLNDNLFPLGADTYLITRGMRVEIAAVVIICLIGIIFQIKPWKVVRKKRGKKAANLPGSQRYLEEEEDVAGRNIEAQTARERVERGKVYGGRAPFNRNGTIAHHSDGTDGGSNSKSPSGGHSESAFTGSKVNGIRMMDFSDSNVVQTGVTGLIHADMAKDSKVMVRVSTYEVTETPNDSEDEATNRKTSAIGDSSASQRDVAKGIKISQANSGLRRRSPQRTITMAAEVLSSSLKIPTEDNLKINNGRSSVATIADDEAIAPAAFPRDSLVKEASQSSVILLRSLSQQKLKRDSSKHQMESGGSSEELALGDLGISIKMPSSGIVRYAQDDMSTRLRPSSYVDYFSHNWTQEAIQKSWRYIASNSSELDNAARLENASLRIWIKHMNKLKTIPPEALNWYKDYDVTWLYGPLQTNDGILTSNNKTISSSSDKKSSLKKRSTLDTISQGSFFSTSIDQLNKINGITKVTNIQFRLLPSSILRLLFSTGEGKHVRFSQEITVYSYWPSRGFTHGTDSIRWPCISARGTSMQ